MLKPKKTLNKKIMKKWNKIVIIPSSIAAIVGGLALFLTNIDTIKQHILIYFENPIINISCNVNYNESAYIDTANININTSFKIIIHIQNKGEVKLNDLEIKAPHYDSNSFKFNPINIYKGSLNQNTTDSSVYKFKANREGLENISISVVSKKAKIDTTFNVYIKTIPMPKHFCVKISTDIPELRSHINNKIIELIEHNTNFNYDSTSNDNVVKIAIQGGIRKETDNFNFSIFDPGRIEIKINDTLIFSKRLDKINPGVGTANQDNVEIVNCLINKINSIINNNCERIINNFRNLP